MSNYITKEGIEVKVGQVWRDLDKRMGSTGTVIALFIREQNDWRGKRAIPSARIARGSRTTSVAIDRMHRHSTGWELVKE